MKSNKKLKVLFAASEAYPLIKTGGLGDVIYGLPRALKALGVDVRVVLPAYREILEYMPEHKIAGWLDIMGAGHQHPVRIIESRDDRLEVPLILVDSAELFDRTGNPYSHPDGYDWPDNAERFTVFSHAVAQIASGEPDIGWMPDIVHSHDWQTGLIPALLYHYIRSPANIFTIHNLSYAGIFSHADYAALRLPEDWWSSEGLEFHGNFSLLKAGLLYADKVTTVSPTYAKEILLSEFSYGFEGVLQSISKKLSGILNGIDGGVWNPETDPHIKHHYSAKSSPVEGKLENKSALLAEMGMGKTKNNLSAPLIGFVGRLVEQKGIDLILDVIPDLMEKTSVNFVILGTGQDYFERMLLHLAAQYRKRISFHSGYSETLAHRIEAGADLFLMPSRFEPCGLNQLYSLRYGTLPVVHNTGGLADTVVGATENTITNKTATGFTFNSLTAEAILACLTYALELYQDQSVWKQMICTAMQEDFSWEKSANAYKDLYAEVLNSRNL